MLWPFGDLNMFGYRVAYIDPPVRFEAGGDRGANRHYETMTMEEIGDLPVGHLLQPNAAVFLWATDPLLDVTIEMAKRRWGLRYVSVGFYWVKTTKHGKWHIGTGYGTRANPEQCLLFMNGEMGLPKDRGVRRLIVEPAREHSRKPDRIPGDIKRLYDGPYVELFARTRRPGWEAWGAEVDRFETAV